MIFWQEHNLAFLHINRTGGSSVTRVLMNAFGTPDEGSTLSRYSGGKGNIHQPLSERLEDLEYLGVNISSLIIYTNIRDPFERAVSLWAKLFENGVTSNTFKTFFYTSLLEGKRTKIGLTRGTFEEYLSVGGEIPSNLVPIRFEEDWVSQWKDIIGDHSIEFPHQTPSFHGLAHSYFDKEMKRLMIEREIWFIDRFYPHLKELV